MKIRRALRYIFFALAGLFAAAWAFGYLYISGLACAFSGPNVRSCTMPKPWNLRGDDLLLMVLIPGSVLLALLAAGWLVGRKPRQPQNSDS